MKLCKHVGRNRLTILINLKYEYDDHKYNYTR